MEECHIFSEKSALFDVGVRKTGQWGCQYEADGYWRGPIWAPSTHLLVDGLLACGERSLALEISRRFCDMAQHSGMAENYNALTGESLRDRAYTWTASVFLLLGHLLLKEETE
jgi:putative isomerase